MFAIMLTGEDEHVNIVFSRYHSCTKRLPSVSLFFTYGTVNFNSM